LEFPPEFEPELDELLEEELELLDEDEELLEELLELEEELLLELEASVTVTGALTTSLPVLLLITTA